MSFSILIIPFSIQTCCNIPILQYKLYLKLKSFKTKMLIFFSLKPAVLQSLLSKCQVPFFYCFWQKHLSNALPILPYILKLHHQKISICKVDSKNNHFHYPISNSPHFLPGVLLYILTEYYLHPTTPHLWTISTQIRICYAYVTFYQVNTIGLTLYI